MNCDAKATYLSHCLQVVADEILLGGWCAIKQCSGDPAHAQKKVRETQVEKRANLKEVKFVSRFEQWSQQPHGHQQHLDVFSPPDL